MALDIQRIRAICFDVDGTLSDTDDQFEQTLERILFPLKVFLPNQDIRSIARSIVMFSESPGNLLLETLDKLHLDDKISALGDHFFHKGHINPDRFKLIPGVHEILSQLKIHYPLSIISARGERSTQRFLDQFQLHSFFQCVASAHTCTHTKPYPDPIVWVAKQLGVKPDECLMVGDTTIDIRAAKAAGAQSIGVLCGFGKESELIHAGADCILKSTALVADELLTLS
jgi:HAD superfamily hydrolase (TIGR01509 family)